MKTPMHTLLCSFSTAFLSMSLYVYTKICFVGNYFCVNSINMDTKKAEFYTQKIHGAIQNVWMSEQGWIVQVLLFSCVCTQQMHIHYTCNSCLTLSHTLRPCSRSPPSWTPFTVQTAPRQCPETKGLWWRWCVDGNNVQKGGLGDVLWLNLSSLSYILNLAVF